MVLQKEGAPLINIQCPFDLTLDKFWKLAKVDSPDKYIDILAPAKVKNILTDLGEMRNAHVLRVAK